LTGDCHFCEEVPDVFVGAFAVAVGFVGASGVAVAVSFAVAVAFVGASEVGVAVVVANQKGPSF